MGYASAGGRSTSRSSSGSRIRVPDAKRRRCSGPLRGCGAVADAASSSRAARTGRSSRPRSDAKPLRRGSRPRPSPGNLRRPGSVQVRELPRANSHEHQHGGDSVRAVRIEDLLQGTTEREEGRESPVKHVRRAVITIEGDGADIVRRALAPEAGREVPRASVAVTGSGSRVVFTITALDTGALRAAINSYLRWVDVAARVREGARP